MGSIVSHIGSLKDKPAATEPNTLRGNIGPNLCASFIYQRPPKNHIKKRKTSHSTGVALRSWHTDPHRNLFPAAGFKVIREGIISQGGPASVPFIIQEANVCWSADSSACFYMPARKWLFLLWFSWCAEPRAEWVNTRSLSSVLLWRAVVNKGGGVVCCVEE